MCRVQPIVVSISWPTGAVPQNLHKMAADLALETAKHLPTGPGATTIAVHR